MASEREFDGHDDENDDAGSGDLTVGEGEELVEKPKARRKANVETAPSRRVVGRFGAVPQTATLWALRRQTQSGPWVLLGARAEGTALEVQEWPLEELCEETILDRWGGGTYRVQWREPNGRPCGTGKIFVLHDDAKPQAAAAPSAATATGLPAELSTALAFLGVIQQQANSQMQGMAQFAQMMVGGNKGLDLEVLKLIIGQQQQQSKVLVDAVLQSNEALSKKLDAVFTDEPEDDAASKVAAGVAGAVVKPLMKVSDRTSATEAMKVSAVNAFAEDPIGAVRTLVDLAKAVPGAIGAFKQIMAEQAPPSPPAPKPKARLSVVENPPNMNGGGTLLPMPRASEQQQVTPPEGNA